MNKKNRTLGIAVLAAMLVMAVGVSALPQRDVRFNTNLLATTAVTTSQVGYECVQHYKPWGWFNHNTCQSWERAKQLDALPYPDVLLRSVGSDGSVWYYYGQPSIKVVTRPSLVGRSTMYAQD